MSKTNETVYIMDEMGEQYEVREVGQMLNSLLDEDLADIYKSTKYFNELNLAIVECVEAGLIEQIDGEEYQGELVKKGLKALSDEILKRSGKAVLESYNKEVDLAWQENKPDLDKYKNKDKEDE